MDRTFFALSHPTRRALLERLAGARTLVVFLDDLQWSDADAGAVLAEKDDGHIRAGATGFGVLTLWSLIEAAAN